MTYMPSMGNYAANQITTGAAGAGGGLGGLLAGLGPMALPLLISFGPAIFSKVMDQIRGNPQQRLRDEIAKLQSPENIAALTNKYYQTAMAGPAYQGALGSIASGANQTAGNLAQSLGARGIGTTGTGAILSSLTPSIVGSQQAALRTKAYESSQQQAMDEIKARISALTGTQGPSQTQQYLGAGLSAISPYLQQFLGSKYPDIFGPKETKPSGAEHGKEGVGAGTSTASLWSPYGMRRNSSGGYDEYLNPEWRSRYGSNYVGMNG